MTDELEARQHSLYNVMPKSEGEETMKPWTETREDIDQHIDGMMGQRNGRETLAAMPDEEIREVAEALAEVVPDLEWTGDDLVRYAQEVREENTR